LTLCGIELRSFLAGAGAVIALWCFVQAFRTEEGP
jgi:hypothetical protein